MWYLSYTVFHSAHINSNSFKMHHNGENTCGYYVPTSILIQIICHAGSLQREPLSTNPDDVSSLSSLSVTRATFAVMEYLAFLSFLFYSKITQM